MAYDVVAPIVDNIMLLNGTTVAPKHKVDGVPSLLLDAIAILASADGAALPARNSTAKAFVTNMFAYCK